MSDDDKCKATELCKVGPASRHWSCHILHMFHPSEITPYNISERCSLFLPLQWGAGPLP
jgi:hypothetical protein